MKKYAFLVSLFFFGLTQLSHAQLKIGYVDSDTIMDKLPDAQDAQQKLDALIKDWQTELNKLEKDWKDKYDDYEKRKLIMSDQTRAETEAELVKLEEKMNDYRQKKFGTNGELFQKQDEVMKPIQNRVFDAIKKVAEEQDLDFVFDRSGDVLFLYAKEKYDITNLVLQKLK
ncbi:MAG: OmpH family outer membrane protein [Bacteroidota bacterium]|jgi:outer membrane protein|nr:OmpH family outer membrane protein [Ignavibacteria bacterium]HEX2961976.1 OmpH family outer membrane protein [Ignavibacteriales bacterium]MCU7500226.1 OmpH family outer membrane protein [Ignavibacteria bacterium]MCU7511599.1 OmpH family outer membrane protein [Ignavibacteria bacterium]MCU7522088.1 OmpH family outer membrane protein [Ignavibacteria bacterium]